MSGAHERTLSLVTGASAGIGAAFARALAARGEDLVLVARTRSRLEELASELESRFGREVIVLPVDLSRADAADAVFEGLKGRAIGRLVNNAGFGVPRIFTDAPWEVQNAALMTMAVTPCALAYRALPQMVERGDGSIINVASIAGFAPGVAGNTLYPGVKALMIKFSQALDLEYRAKGIRVTALCPGPTRTEFMERSGVAAPATPLDLGPEEVVAAGLAANAAGRVVEVPGLAVKGVAFLLRRLPEALVRTVVNAGAARYLAKDGP